MKPKISIQRYAHISSIALPSWTVTRLAWWIQISTLAMVCFAWICLLILFKSHPQLIHTYTCRDDSTYGESEEEEPKINCAHFDRWLDRRFHKILTNGEQAGLAPRVCPIGTWLSANASSRWSWYWLVSLLTIIISIQ